MVLAAAGSGKTHVLVERYLALLAANPDWPLESLVAITFTRKAARETARTGASRSCSSARNLPKRRNARLWQTHLANIESAHISTIDGLCARLLRLSAAEAGIDPDFQVLDENLVDIELERALEQELERLAAANDSDANTFRRIRPRSNHQNASRAGEAADPDAAAGGLAAALAAAPGMPKC